MTYSSIIALSIGMFILAISPGPCFFTATTRAITGGFWAGAGIMAGAFFGDLIYMLLAIAGMAWIAEQMGDAFIWVKILGGLYLVWMGVSLFFEKPEKTRAKANVKRSFVHSMLEGALLTMSNPKVIVFYASFLPAFVDLNTITLRDVGILIAISFFIGSTIDFAYVWLAAIARNFFKNEKAQRRLNQMGGCVLMGVGAALTVSK